jgi:hypothetical protein
VEHNKNNMTTTNINTTNNSSTSITMTRTSGGLLRTVWQRWTEPSGRLAKPLRVKRMRAPKDKFQVGDLVWCDREKQYGTIEIGASLRWSDMRSDAKATPGYRVRFKNGLYLTVLETDLQSVNAYRLARVSGLAKQHSDLVKTIATVGTVGSAVAGIAGLLLKVFGVLP